MRHGLNPRAASGGCGRARGRPRKDRHNFGATNTCGHANRHNFVGSDRHKIFEHVVDDCLPSSVRRPQSCARRPKPGLQRKRRVARVLCVCDSMCSVICVEGGRFRSTCAGE
jgi:hypothetical protein